MGEEEKMEHTARMAQAQRLLALLNRAHDEEARGAWVDALMLCGTVERGILSLPPNAHLSQALAHLYTFAGCIIHSHVN